MSRAVVLAFSNEAGVEEMRAALTSLRQQHLVSLAEPAVVVRNPDGKVTVRSTVGLALPAALFGAFCGLMIGLLFSTPWLGLGLGAAAGAVIGAVADVGVQAQCLKQVGHTLAPGHSALLLMAHDWTDDRVLEQEVARFEGVVVDSQ